MHCLINRTGLGYFLLFYPNLSHMWHISRCRIVILKQNAKIPYFQFHFLNKGLLCIIQGNGEERHIEQMQYTSWPDHGVPDESTDFLEFVQKVRQNRAGMVEPTIVHCR